MPQALENQHRCGYTPHPPHISVQQLTGVHPGRVNLSAERRSSCCLALLNGPLPLCPNKHFFCLLFSVAKVRSWSGVRLAYNHTQRVPMFLFCRSLLTECRRLKMRLQDSLFICCFIRMKLPEMTLQVLAWNPSDVDMFHISKTSGFLVFFVTTVKRFPVWQPFNV